MKIWTSKGSILIAGLALAHMLIYALLTILLPFSLGFRALASQIHPATSLLFTLFHSLWLAYAVSLAAVHVPSPELPLAYIGYVSLLPQSEILAFGGAFPSITQADIFLIALAGAIPLFLISEGAAKIFGENARRRPVFWVPEKLLLAGVIYLFIYFIFGYYTAWQSGALRQFYSGSVYELGFFTKIADNWHNIPWIFPFQMFRGMLFAFFALPFAGENRYSTLLMLALSSASALIIPNPLFPDAVRFAHLWEMLSSMAFLSVALWTIFFIKKAPR